MCKVGETVQRLQTAPGHKNSVKMKAPRGSDASLEALKLYDMKLLRSSNHWCGNDRL